MSSQIYPPFLQSYANMQNHFAEQFDDLDAQERGNFFAAFSEKLLPLTSFGKNFESSQQRKKSYDEGVDLIAESPNNSSKLLTQAKYRFKGIDTFDNIISKFQSFSSDHYGESAGPLFAQSGVYLDELAPELYFQIITIHDLKAIIQKYEASSRPSKQFYESLTRQNRLEIIDGPKILELLQSAYKKSHVPPNECVLKFATDFIRLGNVYVGIVSSEALRNMYEQFGDSLFFENIRDYQKTMSGQLTSVNAEIKKTIETDPTQFLSRNNGLVFKANQVEIKSPNVLTLYNTSIVNGCQTTMVLVENATRDTECFVVAKIVATEEAWNLTHAANYQNEIKRLDLDLSRYLTPPRIKKIAAYQGVSLENNNSAFAVLDSVYQQRIAFDELKSLFIGLFSRLPKNIFSKQYDELRGNVIDLFYENDPELFELFSALFEIQAAANRSSSILKARIEAKSVDPNDPYQRLLKEDNPAYRAFLTLVTASAATEIDISQQSLPNEKNTNSTEAKYNLITEFISKTLRLIETDYEIFDQYYRAAFQAIISKVPQKKPGEISQYFWSIMRNYDFEALLTQTHYNHAAM